MGRKASYTDEQLQTISDEMITNKWTVKDAAEKNSIMKLEKMTLYMALKKKGLPTVVKDKTAVAVV